MQYRFIEGVACECAFTGEPRVVDDLVVAKNRFRLGKVFYEIGGVLIGRVPLEIFPCLGNAGMESDHSVG